MANMGTVSVSYQQFRIKRNLQETKKPAHPGKKIARAAGSKLSFLFPPPKNVLRSSGWPHITLEAFFNDGGRLTNARISHGERVSRGSYFTSGFH
jgi:hypothetical protein